MKGAGLMARYREARRAPWWLRAPGVSIERLYLEPAGDPRPADVAAKDPV